jgi:hypothetical protein
VFKEKNMLRRVLIKPQKPGAGNREPVENENVKTRTRVLTQNLYLAKLTLTSHMNQYSSICWISDIE